MRRLLVSLISSGSTCSSSVATSTTQQAVLQTTRCLATATRLAWLMPASEQQPQMPQHQLRGQHSMPHQHQQLQLHEQQASPRGLLQGTLQGQQRRGMFIQTQPTPNPQSLIFLPGRPVMENGSYDFANARAGMVSPLAKKLFMVDGVTGVFFGSDFVTVTKSDDYVWAVLKPDIFAAIMDHFSSGEPLFTDKEALAASDTAIHEDDDEIVAMIKELLETRIRPAVQEDGGDIVYKGFDPDSGTVTLKMMGACSGCPSSAVTLKSGIENMLMHYIPEVKQVVEAPPDEGEQEALKAFDSLEQQLAGSSSSSGSSASSSL